MRRGLGKTFGKGYYNLVPLDHHIHSLSAKGVSTVNVTKYQGKWYDQASFPTWFDKDCKGQRAEYKVRPDGKIDVLNTCLKDTGVSQIKGTARSVSKNNKNLKVSFFPLIEGDYNILYLDKGYQNVIVGGKDKKYLWILTRSKKISQEKFNKLKDIAKKKGYDVSKLKVMTLKASTIPELARQMASQEGKVWDSLKTQEHFDYYRQAEQSRKDTSKTMFAKNKLLKLKVPTVEVLSAKQFDTKFKDDYKEWEQGYATTKIMPDGTTNVYVRDDGDYGRDGKLLMHELKEIEIFKDLVNNKGISPDIADEMAHNLNPVKVDGVSDHYDIDPNN